MELTEEQLRTWVNTLRPLSPEQRETLLAALPEDQRAQIRKALAALPIEIPGDLLREIFRGNCVLFVGAGIGREAGVGLPTATELALEIAKECSRLDPEYYRLEAHVHDPLDKVADDYVRMQNVLAPGRGRARLESLLRELIPRAGKEPLDARRGSCPFMVNIPKLSDLIVTTNWDELLEEAVHRYAHGNYDIILNRYDLPMLAERADNTKIIKLHGTISRPESIIIGKEDYEEMKRRLEPAGLLGTLANLLIQRTVLFVGYSLEDTDFRFLYKFLEEATTDPQGRQKGRTHYAIQAEVDYYRKREWGERGIVLIQGRARDFFEKVFIETNEFVNRESQRELRSLAYRPCYEINGMAGTGKSTLLEKIYDDVELARTYRQFFIYKFPPRIADEQEACEGLLSALAKGLGYRETEAERIKYATNRQEWIKETADNLAHYLSVPTLLLFDCTTRLPRHIVQTMERLLQPALEKGSELHAIVASRYPLEWTDHRIRRLFACETLPPFTTMNVRDMLRYYAILKADATLSPEKCSEAAKEIMGITQGHPRAVKWVIEEMGKDQAERPLSNDPTRYVQRHKRRLYEDVIKEVVDKEVLKDVDPELLELLKEILCVFRRLDSAVLRELAEAQEVRALRPAVPLLEHGIGLLRRLGELYLAAGPQERPMYTFDTVMRRILAQHLKLSDPEKYMALHHLAARIFDTEVPRLADQYQLAYIIEGLYHHLQSSKLEGLPQEQYNQIRDLLHGYLKGLHSSGGPRLALLLAAQLKNWIETDEELVDELFERLGERYEGLLRLFPTGSEDFENQWADCVATMQDPSEFGERTCELLQRLTRVLDLKILAPEQGVAHGFYHAFKIDMTPAVRDTRLPETLPFVFLRRFDLSRQDLADLRYLLTEKLRMSHRTAVVVVLDDQIAPRLLGQLDESTIFAYDVVLASRKEIKPILDATDPQRALRRLLFAHMDLAQASPFVFAGPTPPNMFFGREKEIKEIVTTTLSGSVALVGGRRIGKTSILQRVNHITTTTDSKCVPYYLDCQAVEDYGSLFTKMKLSWKWDSLELSPEGFVKMVMSLQNPNRIPLFLMDEIDQMLLFDAKHDERLFKTFRSLSQEKKCCFVFSGEKTLMQRTRDPSSPLFNFCYTLSIGYLDRQSARKLLVEPIQAMDVAMQDLEKIVSKALDATSCHPRLVQYVGHQLLTRLGQRRDRSINLADLSHVLNCTDFHEELVETVWGDATVLERLITLLVAQGHKTPKTIEKQLARLQIDVSPELLKDALINLCAYPILVHAQGNSYRFIASYFPIFIRSSQDLDLMIAGFADKCQQESQK